MLNDFETEALRLLNRHRLGLGLTELLPQADLQEEARKHSQAMAQGKRPFGHEGFEQRVQALQERIGAVAVAENVAEGQEQPGTLVQAWLDSPPHRKNIEENYERTGLAAWQDEEGRGYYTQLFARVRPDVDDAQFCLKLAQAIAVERQRYELPNFLGHSLLNALAAEHAQAMAKGQRTFGHEGFEQRANRIAQDWALQNVAENVALSSESADDVLRSWLQSPAHRQNLLGHFQYSGLGAARDAKGQRFVVQIFVLLETEGA